VSICIVIFVDGQWMKMCSWHHGGASKFNWQSTWSGVQSKSHDGMSKSAWSQMTVQVKYHTKHTKQSTIGMRGGGE
jgi:hypothetical protein